MYSGSTVELAALGREIEAYTWKTHREGAYTQKLHRNGPEEPVYLLLVLGWTTESVIVL
jgi:hypothetical protein